VNCHIPEPKCRCVHLELKGPDHNLRVRQIKVLGEMDGENIYLPVKKSAVDLQQENCETETLRVFRMLTSQVKILILILFVCLFMVFNATCNNISVILWQSVLLVEETCCKSLTDFITWCCIEYTSPWTEFELRTLVVIGTDCTCSCKSNYHTISTTTASNFIDIMDNSSI